jgi:hypothetical protein
MIKNRRSARTPAEILGPTRCPATIGNCLADGSRLPAGTAIVLAIRAAAGMLSAMYPAARSGGCFASLLFASVERQPFGDGNIHKGSRDKRSESAGESIDVSGQFLRRIMFSGPHLELFPHGPAHSA